MKLEDFQKGVVINGQTFVDIRLRLFLTQKEIAEILGVTAKTVSAWENETGGLPRAVSLAMYYLHKFCPPAEKTWKTKRPRVVRFSKGRKSHESSKIATPVTVISESPKKTV